MHVRYLRCYHTKQMPSVEDPDEGLGTRGEGCGRRKDEVGGRREERWVVREEGREKKGEGGDMREEGWKIRGAAGGKRKGGGGESDLRSDPDPLKIFRIRGKYFGSGSVENISDPDPQHCKCMYGVYHQRRKMLFLTDGKTIRGLTLENHVCFYYTFCVLLVSVRGYYGHDTIPRNQFLNQIQVMQFNLSVFQIAKKFKKFKIRAKTLYKVNNTE